VTPNGYPVQPSMNIPADAQSVTIGTDGTVTVVQAGITAPTQIGVIQLAGATANLNGGAITNTGTIEGRGTVGNAISNSGIIEALGGTLTVSDGITNNAGGLMAASMGNKILVTKGLATNAGIINLTGGTFDNNTKTMTNTGQISGYGTFRSGGLTNDGSMTFAGGTTTVNGDVTNNLTRLMRVAQSQALFTGNVTNYGTVKTTNANITYAGAFTNHGAYISDPSSNYFNDDLVIGSVGYLTGGKADEFYLYKSLLNSSTQNTLWSTGQSLLGFSGSGSHTFSLTGADMGAILTGYANNFAWGTFTIASGNSVYLSDGNATPGGAQYVGGISGLDLDGNIIKNIDGKDGSSIFNIYYLSTLPENAYLGGKTYAFLDGGQLIPVAGAPVPIPATVWLLGAGLVGLIGIRRRFQK